MSDIKRNSITDALIRCVLEEKSNVLVTGPGGCGKSTSLRALYDACKMTKVKIANTAMTGKAAFQLVQGTTLHAFLGIGCITKDSKEADLLKRCIHMRKKQRKAIKAVEVLVIDEVSMLGASMMEWVNKWLQWVCDTTALWGGKIVVFSGDFLQLAPINDRWAFLSPLWEQSHLQNFIHDVPYRQSKDPGFYRLLTNIRNQENLDHVCMVLQNMVRSFDYSSLPTTNDNFDMRPPHLVPRNNTVASINRSYVEALTTPIVKGTRAVQFWQGDSKAHARPSIPESWTKWAIETCPDQLTLRIGAQYLLAYNVDTKSGLCNGACLVFMGVDKGWRMHRRGQEPVDFSYGDIMADLSYQPPGSSTIKFVRRGFCLKGGYAISVHKSQGMTLEFAVVDIGRCFTTSLGYVALSRVKHRGGLTLSGFDKMAVLMNPDASAFNRTLVQSPMVAKQTAKHAYDTPSPVQVSRVPSPVDRKRSAPIIVPLEEDHKRIKTQEPVDVSSEVIILTN